MVEFAKWMRKGQLVIANERSGTITRVETVNVDGVKHVKYIYVMLIGGKFSNPYFPADIQPKK